MKNIHAGLFTVALATLMYEILLTRIFSVTMYYHYAFMAISIAMFGLTLGSTLVYVFKNYFHEETARLRLAVFSLLFGVSIPISFVSFLAIPVSPVFEFETARQLLMLGMVYLVIAIPFVFGGVVITLALTKFPQNVSTLYAADLIGAAVGCIVLLYLLNQTTGPTVIIVISGIAAFSAFLFLDKTNKTQRLLRPVAIVATVVLLSFSVWNGFRAEIGQAPLSLRYIKGKAEGSPAYEKWNSYSRITVWGNESDHTRPLGWGFSEKLPADYTVQQLLLYIDSAAGTPLTKFSGDTDRLEFLKYDIINLAHYIRENARVMVAGVGGGRDILSGLVFGQKEIVGIEVNKAIVDTVINTYGDFVGHLERHQNVKIIHDEARSYMSRSGETFDIIQISLIDTFAATAAGAFVLTENSLYTAEAWKIFLEHLNDNGVLTVSRWYFRDRPGEIYRLTSLASQALRDLHMENPREHIVVVRKMEVKQGVETPDGVGTILVNKNPFSADDIAKIKRVSDDLGFEIVLTPQSSLDQTFTALTTQEAPTEFLAHYPINIAPPTDNNPFFFNMLRLRDFVNPTQWALGRNSFNMKAVATLLLLLIITVVCAAIFIIAPLLPVLRGGTKETTFPLVLYFAAIGLGFLLVEISLLQRFILYLGHPEYSLSVVLFSLLLAGGIGSYVTKVLHTDAVFRHGAKLLIVLIVAVGILGFITPHIISAFDSVSLAMRVFISLCIISSMGTVMGTAFPIGMKIASLSSRNLTPFLWGVNGAMSVVASVLAVVIAITAGIATAFLAGVIAYMFALFAFMNVSKKQLAERTSESK